ncbi:hypothetical protein [Cohnella fermenti]|uniref:Uncharacterized protein n=1 Tax=Cohnella fermenti TaxID=2565925 RepID=A0A4S4C5W8_9BACL|nr:hypothetical protein [Cohnella fermenti]THF83230.1 hypothetical protein E6C55_05080 [Cohnella fermenti]
MLTKTVCFALLAVAMLTADLARLRPAGFKEKLVYGTLLAAIMYLGVVFIARKLEWPNLDTLFDLFNGPAKKLVKSLS